MFGIILDFFEIVLYNITMHFVSLVPLSAGVAFVIVMAIIKGVFLLTIAVIALIAWLIYHFFFKKDEPEEEEKDEYDDDIDWNKLMEEQRKDDAEFYRQIGRIEQQLDDIEENVGIKKRRKKK